MKDTIATCKRIGLVGYYGYGNWGDDLMAALLAKTLTEKGYKVSIFNPNTVNNYYHLDTVELISETHIFTNNTDLIVYGGGGVFSSQKVRDIHYWNYIFAISKAAKRKSINFLAISVGGDGSPRQLLSEQQIRFIEEIDFVTCRNEQDLPLFSSEKAEHCHDILWLAADTYRLKKKGKSDLYTNIGINLPVRFKSKILNLFIPKLLVVFLATLSLLKPKVRFVLIDTQIDGADTENTTSSKLGISRIKFGDIEKDLGLFPQLDIIISSRLHLGLVAESAGIPFISLWGQQKTHLMLENTGRKKRASPLRDLFHFFSLLITSRTHFYTPPKKIRKIKESAHRNLERIDMFARNLKKRDA